MYSKHTKNCVCDMSRNALFSPFIRISKSVIVRWLSMLSCLSLCFLIFAFIDIK